MAPPAKRVDAVRAERVRMGFVGWVGPRERDGKELEERKWLMVAHGLRDFYSSPGGGTTLIIPPVGMAP